MKSRRQPRPSGPTTDSVSERPLPSDTPKPDRLPPCGLFRRLASMVYDALLVVGLLMVAAAVVVIPWGSEIRAGTLWFQMYVLIVWWAYFAVCWRLGGQTVGMRAWRLTLVTERGERIGWARSALRFLVAWISAAALGLGFLWSLFDPGRRCWHDMASATSLRVLPKKHKTGSRP